MQLYAEIRRGPIQMAYRRYAKVTSHLNNASNVIAQNLHIPYAPALIAPRFHSTHPIAANQNETRTNPSNDSQSSAMHRTKYVPTNRNVQHFSLSLANAGSDDFESFYRETRGIPEFLR